MITLTEVPPSNMQLAVIAAYDEGEAEDKWSNIQGLKGGPYEDIKNDLSYAAIFTDGKPLSSSVSVYDAEKVGLKIFIIQAIYLDDEGLVLSQEDLWKDL